MRKIIVFGSLLSVFLMMMIPNISAIEYHSIIENVKSEINGTIKEKDNHLDIIQKFQQITKKNRVDNFLNLFKKIIQDHEEYIIWLFLSIAVLFIMGNWKSTTLVRAFMDSGGLIGRTVWFGGYISLPFLFWFSVNKSIGMWEEMSQWPHDLFYWFLLIPSFIFLFLSFDDNLASYVMGYGGPIITLFWILQKLIMPLLSVTCILELWDIYDIDGDGENFTLTNLNFNFFY